MSFSKGGSRQTSKQTGSSGVNTQTQDWLQQIWNAANQAGQSGPSPLITGATGFYGNAQQGGQQGLAALNGDPQAAQRFMNPYQQQVIQAAQQQFGVNDQQALNAVKDEATRAGAFGGTRQGVAEGTALAQQTRDQNQQIAGLLSGGFNDAMNRAAQSAGYGFAGAGANAQLGLQGVGNFNQWLLNQLRQGFVMPSGGWQQGGSSTSQVGAQGGFKIPKFG